MKLARTLEGQYGPKLQDASEEELVALMNCIMISINSRCDRATSTKASTVNCISYAETDELLMNLAAIAYRMRFPVDPLPEDRAIAA